MDDYLKGMVEPPPDQDPHRRERSFVIYEEGTIPPDSARGITESELRKRAVLMYNAQWTCADDVRIDILLYGERK